MLKRNCKEFQQMLVYKDGYFWGIKKPNCLKKKYSKKRFEKVCTKKPYEVELTFYNFSGKLTKIKAIIKNNTLLEYWFNLQDFKQVKNLNDSNLDEYNKLIFQVVSKIYKWDYNSYADFENLVSIGKVGLMKYLTNNKEKVNVKDLTISIESEILRFIKKSEKVFDKTLFAEVIDIDEKGDWILFSENLNNGIIFKSIKITKSKK